MRILWIVARLLLFSGGVAWLYIGGWSLAAWTKRDRLGRHDHRFFVAGLACIGAAGTFFAKLRQVPVWIEVTWLAGGWLMGAFALVVVLLHQWQTGRWRG